MASSTSASSGSSAKKNDTAARAAAARANAARDFDPEVKIGKNGKAKKRRWYHNVADGYRITTQILPETKYWIWGSVAVILILTVVLTILTGRWIMIPLLGIMVALMVALGLLSWKISQARYAQLDGQTGAVGALFDGGRRGWSTSQEPIAVNPKTRDLVYRIVGRPGVVLISEGPPHRVGRMLGDEAKRITRVMPEVPVHQVQVGDGEGQVPISRLWKTIGGIKGAKLTANEVSTVSKRLEAMAVKRMPIPKGIDPNKVRMNRRALRGR